MRPGRCGCCGRISWDGVFQIGMPSVVQNCSVKDIKHGWRLLGILRHVQFSSPNEIGRPGDGNRLKYIHNHCKRSETIRRKMCVRNRFGRFGASGFSRTVNRTQTTTSRQPKLNMKRTLICVSIISVFAAVANAQNANIIWGTPTTISAASDVSTVGALLGTWAPFDGSAPLTVNGVTFTSGDIPGLSTTTDNGGGVGTYASPGTLDANYNTLLTAAA